MKIEAGGVYEFDCDCIQEAKGPSGNQPCSPECGIYSTRPPVRRLDICAANMPTKDDVGRYFRSASGVIPFCRGHLENSSSYGPGYWKGDRWLTAKEVAERGLQATHESQVSATWQAQTLEGAALADAVAKAEQKAARAPGEFRVGDRVRWTFGGDTDTGVVKYVGSTYITALWDKTGVEEAAIITRVELLEPARGLEVASQPTGSEVACASQPSPAPSFTDWLFARKPDPVPWPLWQGAEAPKVARECACCRDGSGVLTDLSKCPECGERSGR